jgi:hypothetical protein
MRNILLFIDNVEATEDLAKKGLKIAWQCKANLLLCNVAKTHIKADILIHHNDDEIILGEDDLIDINELALHLKNIEQPKGIFPQTINCVELNRFKPVEISEMVVFHKIWLIIMDERQLNHMKNIDHSGDTLKVVNNFNCPVLVIPQYFKFGAFKKISYITDLRYCDLGVIQFLKVFNALVFVTHISAPGLPDMEERYAQDIVSESISNTANYNKIFLRNIRKKKNVKVTDSINAVLNTLEINMLALVNKKHQTFERLFDNFPEEIQIYQNLPTLIFPYFTWYNQAFFYT